MVICTYTIHLVLIDIIQSMFVYRRTKNAVIECHLVSDKTDKFRYAIDFQSKFEAP